MRNLFTLWFWICCVWRRFWDGVYARIYRYMPGLTLRGKICFWGKPIIDIRNGGRIEIGVGTRLFSTNFGTHVNYGVPVKLVADRPGAEVVIGSYCAIGGACIHAYGSIRIGDHCVIGAHTNIIDAIGHPTQLAPGQRRDEHVNDADPVVIEDDVWLATNCVVLPGTTIGARTLVTANSVVSGKIPPDSIVAGNPARSIQRTNPTTTAPEWTREAILRIVLDAVTHISEERDLAPWRSASERTPLTGQVDELDSLATLALLLEIEHRLEAASGRHLTLADRNSSPQDPPPFQTVEVLVDHIVKQSAVV